MCASNRFLVPRDMSVGQFIHILGARLRLDPGKALFVFVKDTLPQTSTPLLPNSLNISCMKVDGFLSYFVVFVFTASLIESLYNSSKDDDGFLYMCYSSEKTFGSTHTVMRNEFSLS